MHPGTTQSSANILLNVQSHESEPPGTSWPFLTSLRRYLSCNFFSSVPLPFCCSFLCRYIISSPSIPHLTRTSLTDPSNVHYSPLALVGVEEKVASSNSAFLAGVHRLGVNGSYPSSSNSPRRLSASCLSARCERRGYTVHRERALLKARSWRIGQSWCPKFWDR